jgi:tryptophan 2,3-dioxygenase
MQNRNKDKLFIKLKIEYMYTQIVSQIEEKYKNLGENPETYLKGLLQAKPINYWDYVEVDTLLTLQKPRTDFKDEEIFIMYHQINELILKMMIHEIKQIIYKKETTEAFLINKMSRLNRYTKMLISSFDVMREGMDYDDYNTFRDALTPASGFQSMQFRLIEIYATNIENLIPKEDFLVYLNENSSMEECFEKIYWKAAGINRQTGEKSLTLRDFEDRYEHRYIALAKKVKGKTLENVIQNFENPSTELQSVFKEFDTLYNVAWPLVHLNAASFYLDSKGENKQATGGSEWKKYLHPKHQKRIFFPSLLSENELNTWGINLN